jgi:amino acid adenylation domain-containing protein
MSVSSETARFDLFLSLRESERGLAGTLEYDTDLFEATTVARMLSHFQTLLDGIVADPNRRISDLPILSEAEKHQLLVEWNDTRKDYLQNYCVHELFEQQVERTPEAIAVVFEDQRLIYKELNDRVNQVAHYLRKLGVGPDVLVGLCVERSADMIVALLGILKAGGAYMPIDPDLPGERIRFMLHDSQASFLLTQARLDELIPSFGSKRIMIDRDWPDIAREKTANLDQRQTSDSLAYVVYTSGSTGRPKGVMIPHRGLTNYLCWAIEAYEVPQGQGAPVHSSISFDLTVTSLFAPLLAGRKVVILAENGGVQALADFLRREPRFSFVKLTPAHLSVLAHELLADKLAESSRTFILGGEALSYELLKPWAEHASSSRVINEYGPTETAVGCCAYEADLLGSSSGLVPIGRPIANTQVYILDAYLNPVPLGVTGEIYIGGDGVARGYLNQPELTAEKFITNPFSDYDPTSRLYKTGTAPVICRTGISNSWTALMIR